MRQYKVCAIAFNKYQTNQSLPTFFSSVRLTHYLCVTVATGVCIAHIIVISTSTHLSHVLVTVSVLLLLCQSHNAAISVQGIANCLYVDTTNAIVYWMSHHPVVWTSRNESNPWILCTVCTVDRFSLVQVKIWWAMTKFVYISQTLFACKWQVKQML